MRLDRRRMRQIAGTRFGEGQTSSGVVHGLRGRLRLDAAAGGLSFLLGCSLETASQPALHVEVHKIAAEVRLPAESQLKCLTSFMSISRGPLSVACARRPSSIAIPSCPSSLHAHHDGTRTLDVDKFLLHSVSSSECDADMRT
jgi:hypothetical protein